MAGAVASVCRDADDVARLVVRHHRMRRTGTPVLTVVAAPIASGTRVLAAIDKGLARDVVVVEGADTAAAAWARHLARSPRAKAALARRVGAEVALDAPRTLFDWRRLLGALRLDERESTAAMARALLSGDGEALARVLAPRGGVDASALGRCLALLDAHGLPGLRLVAASVAALDAAASALVPFADRPPMAAEILVPAEVARAWLSRGSSRARALAADGLVRLPERGLGPRQSALYRSKPERQLHEVLESDGLTRGLFATNQPLPIPFGRRKRIEVDLLCARHDLVVEVDGFFHENDAARQKDAARDALLAQRGYHILRVSADDVVDDAVAVGRRVSDFLEQAISRASSAGG
jgi:very-short-patch-repair endonuclease